MQTTINPQLGLLDSLMIATPTNEFLERLVETERGLSAGAVCGTRSQPLGTGVQKHLLEPETAGQPECRMKTHAPNIRRRAGTVAREAQKRRGFQLGRSFSH
jgi:hypothetical protein